MFSLKNVAERHKCQKSYKKYFIREQKKELVARLAGAWTRRGHNLLEIGCESGFFSRFFWESGFDVTALGSDPRMLRAAREAIGSKVDFHLGALDELPFEDNSFDYAAVVTALDRHEQRQAILREACRVAAKGLIFVFRNSFSLYRLSCLKKDKEKWLSVFAARKMCKKVRPSCRATARGILAGPPSLWLDNRACVWINSMASHLPIGAYVGIRLDFGPLQNVTPLGLRIKEACLNPANPAAIFENRGNARDSS